MITDKISPVVDRSWQTLFARAAVYAAFLIVFSLLGELVIVGTLTLTGKQIIFTTFWGFAVSSAMLGFFPTSYFGNSLGMGLSSLSRDKSSIAMTRQKRLALAMFYFVLVVGMGQLTATIQLHRSIHNNVEVQFLYPAWYLMITVISAIANRRRL